MNIGIDIGSTASKVVVYDKSKGNKIFIICIKTEESV